MTTAGKQQAAPPIKFFRTVHAWETWLARHHTTSPGLFVRLAKKSSGVTSVSYQEALDVALCYGWIDGLKKPYDDAYWLQRFTPRGPKSMWSKINRTSALRLIDAGRMTAAGFASIDRAKENGNWDGAYDSHRTATPSPELLVAFKNHPKAKEFFDTLNSLNRFAILMRIQTAKKDETRRKRIDQYVTMLENHEKLVP